MKTFWFLCLHCFPECFALNIPQHHLIMDGMGHNKCSWSHYFWGKLWILLTQTVGHYHLLLAQGGHKHEKSQRSSHIVASAVVFFIELLLATWNWSGNCQLWRMAVPGMVLQSLCVFSARAQRASSIGEVVPLVVHSSLFDNEHNSLSSLQSVCLVPATIHSHKQ